MTRINKERGDLIKPCDKVAKPEKQPSKVVPPEVGRKIFFFFLIFNLKVLVTEKEI